MLNFKLGTKFCVCARRFAFLSHFQPARRPIEADKQRAARSITAGKKQPPQAQLLIKKVKILIWL